MIQALWGARGISCAPLSSPRATSPYCYGRPMRQSQIGRRKNGLPYSRDRWPSRRFALAIRLEEALALRKKAEAICLELGDKSGLGYCYWQWGRLARRQGDKQVEPHTRSAALRQRMLMRSGSTLTSRSVWRTAVI